MIWTLKAGTPYHLDTENGLSEECFLGSDTKVECVHLADGKGYNIYETASGIVLFVNVEKEIR